MVVCAVRYEPVSEAKIPITGKNTGKNVKTGLISRPHHRQTQHPCRFLAKFPVKITGKDLGNNRKFISKNREYQGQKSKRPLIGFSIQAAATGKETS